VLSIEPGSGDGGDEELAAVGVGACGLERGWRVNIFPKARRWGAKRTSVGHGEEEWHVVLVLEVFVSKLLAINALAWQGEGLVVMPRKGWKNK
jgi:hypothetical protein